MLCSLSSFLSFFLAYKDVSEAGHSPKRRYDSTGLHDVTTLKTAFLKNKYRPYTVTTKIRKRQTFECVKSEERDVTRQRAIQNINSTGY